MMLIILATIGMVMLILSSGRRPTCFATLNAHEPPLMLMIVGEHFDTGSDAW